MGLLKRDKWVGSESLSLDRKGNSMSRFSGLTDQDTREGISEFERGREETGTNAVL